MRSQTFIAGAEAPERKSKKQHEKPRRFIFNL